MVRTDFGPPPEVCVTDDIIREIDDEVRRDQYIKLAKRYAPQITAVVVVLALAGGGFFAWQQYKRSRAQREAGEFAAAMTLESSGKLKEAAEAFQALASEGSTGYRALAGLQAAAARAQQGDIAAAVVLYDNLAADASIEQRFRDLARLLAAQRMLDTAAPEQLDERLKPILGADSLWHYSARELAALVRLKAGDVAGARKAFTELSDDLGAPADLRSRATEMLAALPGGS
jgi:hypothetical protein